MLNRFADVTADGQYRSDIQSQPARFFTMIGTLVSGRISIAASANSVSKERTDDRRPVCRPQATIRSLEKRLKETLLLDYPAHQRRLCPLIAKIFALDFALKYLIELNETVLSGNSRSLETLAAGLKAGNHLECNSNYPDLSGSLRRRRVPGGQSPRCAESRHRHLYYL